MNERIKQMRQLAKEEAANLKQAATPEELERLDFDMFDSAEIDRCIYGQMTGNCYSKRAGELIMRCATRVYDYKSAGCGTNCSTSNLNGAPFPVDDRGAAYHSPIEMLIFSEHGGDTDAEKIINYLKGYTDELIFD